MFVILYGHMQMKMEIESNKNTYDGKKEMRVLNTSSIYQNRKGKKPYSIFHLYWAFPLHARIKLLGKARHATGSLPRSRSLTRDPSMIWIWCVATTNIHVLILLLKQSSSQTWMLKEMPCHTKKLTGSENFVTKTKLFIFAGTAFYFDDYYRQGWNIK